MVVVVVGDVDADEGDAPLVGLLGVERNSGVLLGDGLAHHPGADAPGPVLRVEDLFLEGLAGAAGVGIGVAGGGKAGCVAADEVDVVLLKEVAEAGDVGTAGAAADGGDIGVAVVGGVDTCAEVVKGDIFAEEAVVIAEACGEAAGLGVEEDEVGIECGAVYKDDGCVVFDHFLGLRVDDVDAGGFAELLIVDDGVDDRVVAHGEVSRAGGPGKGAAIAAEIGAKGAAAGAEVALHAWGAALLCVVLVISCDVGAARCDEVAVLVVGCEVVLKVFFDAGELEGWQEFAIGQRGEVFNAAGDACEFLDVRIPGGELLVGERPLDRETVAGGAVEIVLAPALRPPGPHEGFAAGLVAADPLEGLFLDVGVLLVFDEKVIGIFVEGVGAVGDGVFLAELLVALAGVFELPGVHVRRRVVNYVAHLAAALENERLEALVAELFGGPPAGHAGADDDGVVGVLFFGVDV